MDTIAVFNTNNNLIFNNYPDVVSVYDLMEMLDIGQVLAYRLLKDKKITARKIGREYKIAKTAVVSFLLKEEAGI